ncbi:MAG: PQQ-dependent sugar dehydrogenase [Thermoproteota archaeon]|nr:PQQ-dependent sugar dehydrogenase [Thermoproteota archaeon]
MSYKDVDTKIVLLITIVLGVLLFIAFCNSLVNTKAAEATVDRNYPESNLPSSTGPNITDPHLKAEVVFRGLAYPTDIAFLDSNDILVIEKDTGLVRRIVNNTMMKEPLLDVNVATFAHRGLLGIAISNYSSYLDSTLTSAPSDRILNSMIGIQGNKTLAPDSNSPKYVFLYFTAIRGKDGEDITQGKLPVGNVVYRYTFTNDTLIEPKLLLNLPALPGAIGNGGKLLINPYDSNLYVTVGGMGINGHETKAQNVWNGKDPDGTSGILVVTQDGKPVSQKGILGDRDPINMYYAYGIWNSFGIDFDPVTRKLWDTENGVIFGDEINLVEPGFNSGWNKIDGIWLRGNPLADAEDYVAPRETDNLLVDFDGKGKYIPPKFTWFDDIGPTAIKFFNSDKLGDHYQDDIFVGDIINGNIYRFELDKQRTELLLPINSSLSDKVVSSNENDDKIIFARGFGGITDIEMGPDGYLYVLTFNDRLGTIYRILTNGSS